MVVGAILSSLAGSVLPSLIGSGIQAYGERKARKGLEEAERIPRQFREGALTELGGIYGLTGDEDAQQRAVDRAMASPVYRALMGQEEEGKQSLLGAASARGELRSGNLGTAMERYSTQLQNQALLQAYNQQMLGLQGLANLPTHAPQIASMASKPYRTLGQGVVGAAQAIGTGKQREFERGIAQREFDLMGGLGSSGGGGIDVTQPVGYTPITETLDYGMFSDRLLKKDIKKIGTYNGFNIYSWIWNKAAKTLGLSGSSVGVMADEVYKKDKKAVTVKNNYMWVNYKRIGVLPCQ